MKRTAHTESKKTYEARQETRSSMLNITTRAMLNSSAYDEEFLKVYDNLSDDVALSWSSENYMWLRDIANRCGIYALGCFMICNYLTNYLLGETYRALDHAIFLSLLLLLLVFYRHSMVTFYHIPESFSNLTDIIRT